MTWTFDPLVARNGYFNVVKLGAQLTRYYVDFYGPMDDGINNGDETDRCLVTWWLRSPRATEAAAGTVEATDIDALRARGAVEVLTRDPSGAPQTQPATADVRLVQVPLDIVELRHRDPGLAKAWRLALRETLVPAFEEGLEVVGVTTRRLVRRRASVVLTAVRQRQLRRLAARTESASPAAQ